MLSYKEWIKEHPEHDPGPQDPDTLISDWMKRFAESIAAYCQDEVDKCLKQKSNPRSAPTQRPKG